MDRAEGAAGILSHQRHAPLETNEVGLTKARLGGPRWGEPLEGVTRRPLRRPSLQKLRTPAPGAVSPHTQAPYPCPGACTVTCLDSSGQVGGCLAGAVHSPSSHRHSHLHLGLWEGGGSFPLWSHPQVQLCPARPGLAVLERLWFCCFQELGQLCGCPPEHLVLLNQKQSDFPTSPRIPPPP